MEKRFENRVVLLTGAGTGMGRAVAIRLASEGAAVALWGRRADPLEAVAKDIRDAGGTALVQTCDISGADEIAASLEITLKQFGKLDAVFANAGHLGDFNRCGTLRRPILTTSSGPT